MATLGGPALSVSVQTGGQQQGGPAIPVAVVTDGRATQGGPATPVYVVTSGPMQGGPALPVVAAASGARVAGGPAIPVYVVSGSFAAPVDPTMVYTNKVIATGPIAYWPLADLSGTTATDESGNGRNGVYKANGEPLLGQTGIGDGRTAPLFDGSNDFTNVFSAALAAAFNGAEGTLAAWFQVTSAAVWTDATVRRVFMFQADANNRVFVTRSATNSMISSFYIAGGTTKQRDWTTSDPTGWQHIALTWSKSADQAKLYANGVQQGVTSTGLGVFAGSLATTTTTIGASNTTGANPWKGYLAHIAVWTSPLSAATIATLASVT